MENTVSLTEQSGMSPKKVKTLRILAFTLVVIKLIVHVFEFKIIQYCTLKDISFDTVIILLDGFLIFGTWLSLSVLAPNKPVRIAAILMSAHYFLSFIPYGFLVSPFLCMYLWAVILSNTKYGSWIYMLPILVFGLVIARVMRLIYFELDPQLNMFDMWYNSSLSLGRSLFFPIQCIFEAIAMYKLCFSEAFSGNYDKDFQGTYSPLNKYFIGGLIAVGVTCGLLTLVFVYGNDIMAIF